MTAASPDLTDLANAFGTDKGSLVGNAHCYTTLYEKMFAARRLEPLRILEIGLAIGGPEVGVDASRQVPDVPSVKLWLEFFPNATVTGLDISDCSAFQTERFSFIRADCGDQEALRLAAAGRQFDIVIDDGSHASFHQQLTLLEFFPTLAPGGVYIIEDLDWQPEAYELILPPVPTTARLLEWLAAGGSSEQGPLGYDRWRAVMAEVASYEAYRASQLKAMVPPRQRKPGPPRTWLEILGINKPPRNPDELKLIVLTKK